MTWTAPVTRATGYIVLAADWNNEHVNNLLHLHGDAGTVVLSQGGIAYHFTGVYVEQYGASTTFGAGGGGNAGIYTDAAGRIQTTQTTDLNILASSRTTDSQYRFTVSTLGVLSWGPGGAVAADTTLQRSAAVPPSSGQVGLYCQQAFYSTNTTGGFIYTAGSNNSAFLSFALASDANPMFKIFTQGALAWGAGGASTIDLELGRVVNAPTGTGSFLELIIGDGLGYGTGCGGTLTTTAASPGTGTINAPSGKITSGSSIAAASPGYYTITNSCVGTSDTVVVSLQNGAASTQYQVYCVAVTAGSFKIYFFNGGAGAITPIFNFAVIKGATS